MRHWMIFSLAVVTAAAVAIGSLFGLMPAQTADTPPDSSLILIDPGHGGEDGGTAAVDGTLEKNINLAIALYLRDLLVVSGYPVAMTRDTDISIHDAGCTTTREKKVSDMHNRLELYNRAACVIGIHQNHFSASKYHGAQVFYSGNSPQSQLLAETVQARLVRELQPDNNRLTKQATDGIYLLYHAQPPAILVECGFLSNPEEREKLCTPAYQQAVAGAIFAGLADHWNTTTQE